MNTQACAEHMVIGCTDCKPYPLNAERCIYCGSRTYIPGHGCDSCGMATLEDIGEGLSNE